MGRRALVIGHSAELLTEPPRAADPAVNPGNYFTVMEIQMNADEFNQKFLVGSDVIYTDDFGNEHKTKTRSAAWTLGHGDVVVSIEGKSGGYDITRIKPV